MALKPQHGTWAYGADAYTPVAAARAVAWMDPEHPGDWSRIGRTFRDGHTATWWAAEARLGWWGPDGNVRLVVATADPATLPAKATWYLATDLPRPGSPRAADCPHPPADLAEIVRIYGLRHWVEQSYKQVKDELGWADFQVRSDTAIRRHQAWSTSPLSLLLGHLVRPAPARRPATRPRHIVREGDSRSLSSLNRPAGPRPPGPSVAG